MQTRSSAVRTSRFRGLAADVAGFESGGDSGGGDTVANVGCGSGGELAADNSPVYLVVDTLWDDGSAKVRNAVAAAAARREARAAARQQDADIIAPRWLGRRPRDEAGDCAVAAVRCHGGIGGNVTEGMEGTQGRARGRKWEAEKLNSRGETPLI